MEITQTAMTRKMSTQQTTKKPALDPKPTPHQERVYPSFPDKVEYWLQYYERLSNRD
jgi:hypothetical protein